MEATFNARELAARKLEALTDDKVASALAFLSYLECQEEWIATQELLSDPGMRADIEEGLAQAARGEGRSWRDARAAL